MKAPITTHTVGRKRDLPEVKFEAVSYKSIFFARVLNRNSSAI